MAMKCKDIETLLATYLDGELTEAEQLAFEHHLGDCKVCADQVSAQGRELEQLRTLLRAPAPPTALGAHIRDALDREDRHEARQKRRSSWAWLLPTGAGMAAAAALALFAFTELRPASEPVAEAPALRQAAQSRFDDSPVRRGSPQEISVAAGQYLRMPLTPPRFSMAGSTLKGWRPAELSGKQAAILHYEVPDSRGTYHSITVHVVDARHLDLRGKQRIPLGDTDIWIGHFKGINTVSYKDQYGIGYVFSSDMPLADLVASVHESDVLYRMSEALHGN